MKINIVPNNKDEAIKRTSSFVMETVIGEYRLEKVTVTYHNGFTINLN